MSPSPPPTTSTTSSLILLPLSPASSRSSLTFEEVSFNYNDPLEDGNSQQGDTTSGSGDLVRTHGREAKDTKNSEERGRQEVGRPGNRRRTSIKLFEGSDQRAEGPFAREVTIKGWKIVGGESWTDVAKLGAYVGGYKIPAAPSRVSSAEAMAVVYDIDIKLKDVSLDSMLRQWGMRGQLLNFVALQGGKLNILRRYTDFVKLRKALRIKYHVSWVQSQRTTRCNLLMLMKYSSICGKRSPLYQGKCT